MDSRPDKGQLWIRIYRDGMGIGFELYPKNHQQVKRLWELIELRGNIKVMWGCTMMIEESDENE